ncbi:MAG: hypothetical protein ORN29_00960 [Rhodoferax sp.]|nr:hypothetical protein [Rhodoferax sp.]
MYKSGTSALPHMMACGGTDITVPLSYQWQKNGSNIPDATSGTYTTPLTPRLPPAARTTGRCIR